MTKNILKIIAFFIIGMIGGIFADQIFWPYFVERPLFYQYRLEQSPVYVTERKEVIIQENVAIIEAIEKVEKTIVGVRTETVSQEVLEGSGLIVTSDGLMVTLASLVPKGSDFLFYIEGEPSSYQILKRDLETDLALVKIGEGNLPTVSFANLDKIKLGERVFLVGVIFEDEEPLRMVNEGIVKSFDEDFITTNIFEEDTLKGSPLFNIEGEALGINIVDSGGGIITIPISKVKTFIGM